MLPIANETPRMCELRAIVEASPPNEMFRWPRPNEGDLKTFGNIIVLFNSLDFLQRLIAETMDDNGMLEKPFATKTRKLTISNISKAIQSSSIWKGRNEKALEAIDIHRRIRNLVAHFAVRRFPTEDAYIFMTKSSADFKQVFGALPASDALLYGVTESAQMAGLIPVLEGLVSWSSKVANDLSSPTEMPPRTEMI